MSDRLRYGEILVRAGVLSRKALNAVIADTHLDTFDLGEVLVSQGLIREDVMLKTISKALNVPLIDLERLDADQRALGLVPRAVCVEHFVLPVEIESNRSGEHLHLAMANPSDVRAIKQVTRQARLRIRPSIAAARQIRESIEKSYGGTIAPPPRSVARSVAPQRPKIEPSKPTSLFDFGVVDLSGSTVDLGATERATPLAPTPNPSTAKAKRPRSGRRRITRSDSDLSDALDAAAQQPVVGDGSAFDNGVEKPRASRRRSSGSMGVVRKGAATRSGPEELPPLPPGIRRRSEMTSRAPRSSSAPPNPISASRPPSRAPAIAPPRVAPQTPPPSPTALPSVPKPDLDPFSQQHQPPPGVIDDMQDIDVHGVLKRYVDDIQSSSESGDEVISQYLDRIGNVGAVNDQFFETLELALGRTRSASGRLLIALIRQLARRGLVDLVELVSEARDS